MFANIEYKYSKFISVGLFITTIIVLAGPVSEPVNVPKMVTLVTFVFGAASILFLRNDFFTKKTNRFLSVLVLLFIVLLFVSSFLSDSPFSQNIYGVYGRNTGLLTFMSFSILLLIISTFSERKSIEYILHGFFLAGIANVTYGMITVIFGDPIPWNNNYGALLGTLGNPNFAGSFYAMVSAGFIILALHNKNQVFKLVIYLLLSFFSFFCVYQTKTTQGVLVFFTCIIIVFFIYAIKVVKKNYVTYGLAIVSVMSIGLIIAGILQKGPLVHLLYKRSVSLRGVYWDAAFETGKSNLFAGVGLDAFGDWYRRERSLKAATWLPGPETVTNAAHNYYLDIFASGGLFLFLIYLSFTYLGFRSCLKILKSVDNFDPIAVILISLFAGFQAQSLISIPQIGIAVWGWVLIGLLYSYSNIVIAPSSFSKSNRNIQLKRQMQSPVGVFIFVGTSIGLLISIPPYAADAKWTRATNSQILQNVELALTPNYFNPANSDRLSNAALLFQRSNFEEQAHKYALQATQFNPENFNAWKVLYYLPRSTNIEKEVALKNMVRLDPLNRNLKALK